MGSRLSEDPENIFDVFLEIARPIDGEDPFILQKFPSDYENEDVLKPAPKFAFPCEVESSQVDHFSFVLTDIEGRFKFGFCRHGVHGSGTCLVIVSQLPWFEIFYKLLNDLAENLNHSDNRDIVPLLTAVHNLNKPHELGESLQKIEVVTPDLNHKFEFVLPDPKQLPSIPENRNLTEYYGAVDINNMMIIFASMLYERRILITSRKLSRLTACIHGSASLIYPMHWQHLYIPVLPAHLVDYVSAPMPFLIGVHTSVMEKVKTMELGDAVVLDVDKNMVITEYDDLQTLPEDIVSNLKKKLKNLQVERLKHTLVGDGVARAFLRALVSLIGGYRDGLKFRAGEQITFDADSYIQKRHSSLRPFLEQMMHLQIFEQFIADRLDLLNDGTGFTDEFEKEATMHVDKSNAQSKYKEWSGQMVRQGRKLKKELREGKDRMAEFTSKVKDKSKKAYKDIRSRLDDKQRKDDFGDSPSSRSFSSLGPTDIRRARPPRPPPPSKGPIGGPRVPTNARGLHDRTSRQYKILTVDGLDTPLERSALAKRHSSQDDSEIYTFTLERISSLMDDPVIKSMAKRSYSSEDLTRPNEEEEEYDEDDGREESLGYAPFMNTEEDVGAVIQNRLATDSTDNQLATKSRESSRSPTPSSTGRLTPLMSRPRPKSPAAGSAGSTGSGEAVLPPPQAPPRKRQDMQQREQELIRLNSGEGGALEAGGRSATLDGFSTLGSEVSLSANMSFEDKKPGDESPRIRASVSRQPAFYKKRTSLATDARTIKEARSAFMQEGNPSNHVYDMFDPLKSGRVALDVPQPCGPETDKLSGNSDGSQEENLLKEWNLDFNKMRISNNQGSAFRNDPLNMYPGLKVAGNRQSQCLEPSANMVNTRPSRPVSMYGQPLRFNQPVNTPAPLPAGLASVPSGLNNGNLGGNQLNTTSPRRSTLRSPSSGQVMGGQALGGSFKTSPLSSAYSSDFGNQPFGSNTAGAGLTASIKKAPPPVPQKPTWVTKKPARPQPPNSDIFQDLDPLKKSPSPQKEAAPPEVPSQSQTNLTNKPNKPMWETFE